MTVLRPLSVAVLLELERGPTSGGHVKCWEHLTEAAGQLAGLDLTVYVLGQRETIEQVGPGARFVALRPVLGNRWLTRTLGGVDATDLAPFHPGLARRLPGHDVWHLTHSFAFTRTALRLARHERRSLVASVHTDVPALTETYVNELVGRLPLAAARSLTRFQLGRRAERLARRARERMLGSCDHVLTANKKDRAEAAAVLGSDRVSHMRRGIDRERFGPRLRAGSEVDTADTPVRILFVGRVDSTKGALLLGQAVRLLRDEGAPVHLVVAGTGADAAHLSGLLGSSVTLLGHVPQRELANVYRGCDVFAFPSRSETVGNVVAEAMASGLPVVLPAGACTGQWLDGSGTDGVLVPSDHPRDWADALRPLVVDEDRRTRMGRQGAATSAAGHPTWSQVLQEDLLPIWDAAASRRLRLGSSPTAGAPRHGDGCPPESP